MIQASAGGGIWALVAVRGRGGKRRLAEMLAPEQRAELVEAMAADVLQALAASEGLAGIALLTADPDFAPLASRYGARLIADGTSAGLNAALAAAASQLAAEGATGLLVLPGDVPMLSASDIAILIDTHRGGVTVARAASDGGTNALMVSPPDAIPFLFGADSADAHLNAARKAGLQAQALAIAGLDLDIDCANDLQDLAGMQGGGRAQALARSLLDRDDEK